MTVSEKVPVWLDCDPGNDDAFALLLAACHPRFRLVGVSTVHGNAPLEMTTHNALGILDVLGFKDEIPVYAGLERPLVKEPHFALDIHGSTGIGGVSLPKMPVVKESTDKTYLEAMRDAILQNPGICVVCTGALTNFAKLVAANPDLKPKIRWVAVMGGAIGIGNVSPYSEFNIFCDPHAAAAVFEDEHLAKKTVLAPLNLTHKAVATAEVRSRIFDANNDATNSSLRQGFHSILMFYAEAYKRNHGISAGPPLHDPLALFALLPMIAKEEGVANDFRFLYLRRHLNVVRGGEHDGETVIVSGDLDEKSEEENGVYVGMDINVDVFWSYVLEALENADVHAKGDRMKVT